MRTQTGQYGLGCRSRCALSSARAPLLFATGALLALLAMGCTDAPVDAGPSVIEPGLALTGSDPTVTCQVGDWTTGYDKEVSYTGHVGSVTNFREPVTCWERSATASFDIDIDFVWSHGEPTAHKVWHIIGYDISCLTTPDGTETIDRRVYGGPSPGHGQPDNGYVADVVFPSGKDCVWAGLINAHDTAGWQTWAPGSDDYELLVKVMTKLAKPTNLHTVAVEVGRVDLAWTNAKMVETQVKRRKAGTTPWTTLATRPPGATTYTDTNFGELGVTYEYVVRHRADTYTLETIRLSDHSTVLQVYVPAPPPAPDPLGVYVTGPDRVKRFQICTWVAVASGGTTPYSYQWSGAATGTGEILNAAIRFPDWLRVTVTDDLGLQARDSMYVTIDPSVGQCAS